MECARKRGDGSVCRHRTVSLYTRMDGSVPHAAIELAAVLALHSSPAKIYCIGLAVTAGCTGVLEANCFNASLLYAASISRVLGAVIDYVLARV